MPKDGAAPTKSGSKPPKGASSASAEAPAPDLGKEEAVEELAQALLREFMHRKGAKAALTIFDEESPRTAKTIKSRGVMTSLMAMQAIQARNSTLDAPHATFMEQLCAYRLRKRRIAAADGERDAADSSGAEDGPAATRDALAETNARIERLRADLDAAKAEREAALAAAAAASSAAAAKPKKAKKGKSAGALLGDAAIADDDDGGDQKKAKKKKDKKAASSSSSKKFDPLGLGGGPHSGGDEGAAELLSGSRSSGGFVATGPVGQGWNPGGFVVPEVGIGANARHAAPAPAAGADGEAAAPTAVKFLAGNGMHLMGTKVRASAEGGAMHFDDSPSKSNRRRSSLDAVGSGKPPPKSAAHGDDDDEPSSPAWEYDYPSPEGGRKQYDPQAAGSGVLKKGQKPRSQRRVVIMSGDDEVEPTPPEVAE